MTIDFNKPVQTRDGRKVRILCTDRKYSQQPIVTLVTAHNNSAEAVYTYRADGKWASDAGVNDLVNVPEEKWLNLYELACGGVYYNTEEAARSAAEGRRSAYTGKYIKSIKVTI